MVQEVCSTASKKLNIEGRTLVLEKDGSPIDEDIFLIHFKLEVLILLQADECWLDNLFVTNVSDNPDPLFNNKLPQNSVQSPRNISETTPAKVSSAAEQSVHNMAISQEQSVHNMADNAKENCTTTENIAQVSETIPASTNGRPELQPVRGRSGFNIPWETFSPQVIHDLEHGILDKATRKRRIVKIANNLVEHMRLTSHLIHKDKITAVAEEMRDTYPKLLEELTPEGERLGNGVMYLVRKMKFRNDYLNRSALSNSLDQELEIPLKKRKALQSIKSGIKSWQPKYTEGTTELQCEEKRQYLLNIAELDLENVQVLQTCIEALEFSYPLQRKFLNNSKHPPTAEDVMESWPSLLRPEFLCAHFSLLTNYKVPDATRRFGVDVKKILTYGLANQWIINCNSANEEGRHWMIVETIFKHFKQNPESLFVFLPVS